MWGAGEPQGGWGVHRLPADVPVSASGRYGVLLVFLFPGVAAGQHPFVAPADSRLVCQQSFCCQGYRSCVGDGARPCCQATGADKRQCVCVMLDVRRLHVSLWCPFTLLHPWYGPLMCPEGSPVAAPSGESVRQAATHCSVQHDTPGLGHGVL